ncbi:DMT family transporter [Saccharopolyspora taberi]|uniref:Magnesium transporter NIPA n=1 Tax=Saccharopolyspora taberi TaxID=60895 RepID=A0ABN3V8K2_9PSEU
MTTLAVLLAALGAVGYAVGARTQHAAVHDTIGDSGLGLRSQLRLLRNTRWLLGALALGTGAVLHACALGLAPLTVVQPIGVLALPITVLLNAREHGIKLRTLDPTVVFAVVASTVGVGAFVVLAAGSAQPTPVAPDDQLLATQLVAGAVLALGVFAMMSRSKVRCVLYAAGCAVAYGYVSLLMRAVVQQVGTTDLLSLNLLPLFGVGIAMIVGGWLLQHGYASGPPDLVVACLTVIDPIVAVGLGIGLLGEADRVGTWTAVGEVLCAAVACAGVFALARFHPETQDRRVPTTVTGSSDLAGPSSTDRPDGSTS